MKIVLGQTSSLFFALIIENQFVMKYLIGSLFFVLSFYSCISTKDDINDNKPSVSINENTTKGLQSGAVDIFRQFVRSSYEDDNVIISPLSI